LQRQPVPDKSLRQQVRVLAAYKDEAREHITQALATAARWRLVAKNGRQFIGQLKNKLRAFRLLYDDWRRSSSQPYLTTHTALRSLDSSPFRSVDQSGCDEDQPADMKAEVLLKDENTDFKTMIGILQKQNAS